MRTYELRAFSTLPPAAQKARAHVSRGNDQQVYAARG
jgi:hypothetical protein